MAAESPDLIDADYDDATVIEDRSDDETTQQDIPNASLAEHIMQSVAMRPPPPARAPTRVDRRPRGVPPADTKPMLLPEHRPSKRPRSKRWVWLSLALAVIAGALAAFIVVSDSIRLS